MDQIKRKNVLIIPLGSRLDLDFVKFSKKLNKTQSIFRFSQASQIESIGPPDITDEHGYKYSFDNFKKLCEKRFSEDIGYYIAITRAPLEGDLFCEAIHNKNLIIITLHEASLSYEKANRSVYDYLALNIVARILDIIFVKHGGDPDELWHEEIRGCIFDHCDVKEDIIQGLKQAYIDKGCKGKLFEHNVPNEYITAFEKILNGLKKIYIYETIQIWIKKPVISFLLGGFLIGISVNLISEFYIKLIPIMIVVLGITLAFSILIFHIRLNYKR